MHLEMRIGIPSVSQLSHRVMMSAICLVYCKYNTLHSLLFPHVKDLHTNLTIPQWEAKEGTEKVQ